MFVLAMYIYHCNKVTTTPYLLYSTSAMFVLGTMQITLKVVIAAIVLHTVKLAVQGGSLVRSTSVHDRLAFVRYLILNANKSVGGTLLFYMGLKVIKSRSALTDSLFVRSRPHDSRILLSGRIDLSLLRGLGAHPLHHILANRHAGHDNRCANRPPS
jgi:hypothetical protein